MKPITQGEFKGKYLDMRPHRILKSGKIVVEIEGEPMVMIIDLDVVRVNQVVEKGGQPFINPKNKLPMYIFDQGMRFNLTSREDYEKLQKSKFEVF